MNTHVLDAVLEADGTVGRRSKCVEILYTAASRDGQGSEGACLNEGRDGVNGREPLVVVHVVARTRDGGLPLLHLLYKTYNNTGNIHATSRKRRIYAPVCL